MSSKHINRSYLPAGETDAFLWLTNLVTNLPGVADALGVSAGVPVLNKACKVLSDAYKYQKEAKAIAMERTGNKDEAAWNPAGRQVLIRPNPAATGPTAIEQSEGGAYPVAVQICDEILLNKTGKTDEAVKDLLKLNPLPKKQPAAGDQPQYEAYIEANQLTVKLTKGRFQYFLVKVDHGTGSFDHDYVVHESPFKDPAPLPLDHPQMWRVQVFGYVKGNPVNIPGDILDVAAKQSSAERAEGAN